jgi:hypothetical protein
LHIFAAANGDEEAGEKAKEYAVYRAIARMVIGYIQKFRITLCI